ncbi:helix-turn-helix domain-containing protein [Ruegeria sp.]|uniref:helix-turn-helix domain-containing protein n=1 Tax=Ruegeria sp. TaxID=1879320 RepID=UPI003C7A8347
MTPNDLIASAIQRERNRQGLSLSALAAKAGLAKSTLSQLESGNGNPSIETLWAIASALEVTFSTLFEISKPETSLVRADEGDRLESEQADYQTTLLANCPPGIRRDLYRVDLEPGSVRRSTAHPTGTVEHAILCIGQARLGPVGSEETLNAGDYYRYPADGPHIYEALSPGTQMVIVMETRD